MTIIEISFVAFTIYMTTVCLFSDLPSTIDIKVGSTYVFKDEKKAS